MNRDRRERIKQLYLAAEELPEERREAFLAAQCGDDMSLIAEVRRLLGASDNVMSGFMQTPALSAPVWRSLEPTPPETIGRYRIGRRLGAGGMGVVYEAVQEPTGRIVALKILAAGYESHAMMSRFEHEAAALGRLRHPGIAQVYEAGLDSSRGPTVPFIAMELVDGPSLLDFVAAESLDTSAVLGLFVKVCDAVHHAHQRGVIHRDLKPGNILVDRTDDQAQPKILDFGIARITDADTLALTLQTQAGQLLGTVKYMSPEQAAGDPAEIDTRSDVYSLGVILYELLARRMPYGTEDTPLHEAVRIIREEEARPLSSIDPAFRGDLTTILGKALDKEKSRRYASAHEMAVDIRRYLTHEPIAAHPPSAIYQLRKFARRNRGLVAGVAIVFVLLVAGIVVTSHQAAVASRAREAERDQRERAERRFNEVRELARTLVFDIDAHIKYLAGSTPARELIVTQGLAYLNSVAEDVAPDDLQLKAELGEAYFKLGDVQGDPSAPNLGDPQGALESYRKGLGFLEACAAARPDEPFPRRSVALACNRIGELLMSMRRREEARTYHDRALAMFEQLSKSFPEDAGTLRELGNCYDIRAEAQRSEGRFDDAYASEMLALETLRGALALAPDDFLTRHATASVSNRLCIILDHLGRHEEAAPHRLACYNILESLVEDDPHNALFHRSLSVAAVDVGQAHMRSNQPAEALPCFEKAVAITEKLVTLDPEFRRGHFDRLKAYTHLGEAQLALGRSAEAGETFRHHLSLAREYLSDNENDAKARRQLAVGLYKMAEVEMALGRDRSLPAVTRQVHWRNAIDRLTQCQDVFVAMRNEGVLGADDSNVADELAAEIANGEVEAAALGKTPENDIKAR